MAFRVGANRLAQRLARLGASVCLSYALLSTIAETRAHAQSGHDTQAADALFEEGRRAMAQGRVRDACTKFKESLDKAPGIGTQLNLADCYDRLGLTASSWNMFKEAEAEARRAGKFDRERTARDRAKQLEPKLGKLIFVLPEKGVEVKRDGIVLDDATLGGPVPTDPGLHKIEVSAKGKKTAILTVEVAQGPVQQKVEVPKLDPDGPAPATAATDPAVSNTPRYSASLPEQPSSGGSTLKTVGLVTAGVGIVSIGVGAYFGIRTYSLWTEVLDRCEPSACDAQGKESGDNAATAGNISTIAFVAGGILTAGGITLFFLAPKASSSDAKNRVYPIVMGGQVGAGWEGRF